MRESCTGVVADFLFLRMHNPLIITLKLEEDAQKYFNTLRNRHFPAHLNFLDAHVTLFHALPSGLPQIPQVLEAFCRRPVMKVGITAIRNTGNGVAYIIDSTALKELHSALQQRFSSWLIAKDQNPVQPHITIQNKVTAYKALKLQQQLQSSFTPFDVCATGFSTWLYARGPWEHIADFDFN